MADANKTSFYFKEESSFGTEAAGGNAFTLTPTSDSIGHTQGFTNSQRIRDDRQIADTIRNSIGAGGDTSIEYSYGDPYNGLLASALQYDWSADSFGLWNGETRTAPRPNAENISVESSVTFDISGLWSSTPTVGNFVKVNGFDTAANNGLFRVSAADPTTITVPSAVLSPEIAGNHVVMTEYTAVLPNGTASATTSGFTHATGWTNNPAVGDWIYVSGFAGSGNNGFFKVSAVTNTTITTTIAPTGGESSVSGIDIVLLPSITNGTYLPSFTLERVFNDAAGAGSDLTDVFVGMCVSGASMSVTPDSPISGAFSWLGKKQSTAGTSSVFASPFPEAETRIFNGVDYVSNIWLGASAVTVTSIDWQLTNNLRQRLVVGQLGALSMGSGTVDVSGTVRLYLADNTEYAKAIADTASSLAFVLTDDDSNSYVFDFPTVHYGEPRRVVPGVNQDVLVDLPFQATRDPVENVTMRVAKL